MEIIIIEDMKKESKPYRNIMILGYFISSMFPLANYLRGQLIGVSASIKTVIMTSLILFLIGSWGLYGWLYTIKYQLIVTKEKIEIKSLFVNRELNVNEITKYTFKKYKNFAQFKLYTSNGGVLISTKYPQELIAVLDAKSNDLN